MIRCIAIDDEPHALEVIKSHAAKVSFLALQQTFVDPWQAAAFVNDNLVDLVFLDINMPEVGGLQLLKNFAKKPLLIFTTAHSEYALASYEVEAVDYLLKPFDYARFLMAVSKAKERLTAGPIQPGDFFFVNTGNQKQRIFYHDILYIEAEGNYVNYFTKSGRFLVRGSIRDTLSLLPPAMFVQIHRSYIVSLQWIDKIEDNQVHLAKIKIAIGATYRDGFWRVIDSLNQRS